MKYFVPDDKKESICDCIVKVLNAKKIHIKVLASLTGKLQFCFKAIGPCIRLLSCSSYHLISNPKNWNSMIEVSDMVKRELHFILEKA